MDDLIKCLYSFVMETRLGDIAGDREYQDAIDAVLRLEDKVRQGMDEEQRQALNLLLSQVSSLNALESRRLFQASLRLSRELNALVRA